MAGRAGFRYIEMSGVFRSSYVDRAGRLIIRLGAERRVVEAVLNTRGMPGIAGMIGARFRARAVASMNRDVYGNVSRVRLWIARTPDLTEIEPAPGHIAVTTIRQLLSSKPEGRVHLHGNVRFDRFGNGLLLTDGTGTIKVDRAPGAVVVTGSGVGVYGFADAGGGRKISDAVLEQGTADSRYASPVKITSVGQVHALSAEAAGRGIPVRVRATVTYINPISGTFFIQDDSGAAFVHAPRVRNLTIQAGDDVEVTGTTGAGDFAPVITNARVERLSAGVMPNPAPAAFDDLFSGMQDSLWVETKGTVQSVSTCCEPEAHVWLQWGEHRYRLLLPNSPGLRLPAPGALHGHPDA